MRTADTVSWHGPRKNVLTASSAAAGADTRRNTELDVCPACGADWKAIDVSHGPGCPKNLLEEAMDTLNGPLVRRCFRILNAKSIGLTITLADITEEEFRVLELIEAERQEQIRRGENCNMTSPARIEMIRGVKYGASILFGHSNTSSGKADLSGRCFSQPMRFVSRYTAASIF